MLPEEGESISGVGRRSLDVNVHEIAVTPEYPLHLLQRDVQFQVSNKQRPKQRNAIVLKSKGSVPSGQGVVFGLEMVQIVGKLVLLILTSTIQQCSKQKGEYTLVPSRPLLIVGPAIASVIETPAPTVIAAPNNSNAHNLNK